MDDFIVLGGGVVGLSFAIAKALKGQRVRVLDRRPFHTGVSDTIDARVYALTAQSQRFLSRLGVWSNCSRMQAYQRMHVYDDDASLDFDCRQIASLQLGDIIEHQVLMDALVRRCQDLAIPLQVITSCEAVEQAQTVKLTVDQQTLESQYLIGADGARSWLRDALAIPVTRWSYDQTALVATITTEVPHNMTAIQRFLATGPLGLLPLPDPHQCSIVWSCETDYAQTLLSLDDEAFMQALTDVVSSKLGRVLTVSPRLSFPLVMQHAKQYVQGRILLVGDAIHTIHPLAGQGLNLGLADVACLDRYDLKYSNRRRFERERKAENWKMILLMEGFKQLFSNSHQWLKPLRQWGLTQVNHSDLLKTFFIEQAQGKREASLPRV